MVNKLSEKPKIKKPKFPSMKKMIYLMRHCIHFNENVIEHRYQQINEQYICYQ